jgi:hypothetical protein
MKFTTSVGNDHPEIDMTIGLDIRGSKSMKLQLAVFNGLFH